MFWAAHEKKMEARSAIQTVVFGQPVNKNMEARLDRQTDVLGAHIHTHTYIN